MDNHQSTSMSFYIQTSSAGHWGHVISVSDLWIKQSVNEMFYWTLGLAEGLWALSGKIIFAIREMLKMKRLDVQDQKHTHMHSPQRLSAGWGPKAWTHRQRKGGQPTIWAHGGCVCVCVALTERRDSARSGWRWDPEGVLRCVSGADPLKALRLRHTPVTLHVCTLVFFFSWTLHQTVMGGRRLLPREQRISFKVPEAWRERRKRNSWKRRLTGRQVRFPLCLLFIVKNNTTI